MTRLMILGMLQMIMMVMVSYFLSLVLGGWGVLLNISMEFLSFTLTPRNLSVHIEIISERKFISVAIVPLSDPEDDKPDDGKKEDDENNNVDTRESRIRGAALLGLQIPPNTSSSGDENDKVKSRIQSGKPSPLFSSMTRSSSLSNISGMMSMRKSKSSDILAQSAHLLDADADRKTNDLTKSLRSIMRQPSRRRSPDHLTHSWHPAPKSALRGIVTELSDHTDHSESKVSKKSFRPIFREPSPDHLTQSWRSAPQSAPEDTLSAQSEHSQEKKVIERPKLKRQKSSISMRFKRRTSSNLPSFRLDPTEMDQVEIIDDHKVHPSRERFRWWHAIFFFSIASLLICLLQLVLPPPYGLMMTSAEVAELGVASGCDDDLERCVCPRETICATDKLSIILLALARCSVFFDYPLYMMMFISKAHNLNNHLRRTLLREWIDFGDMHTVHKIFGVVVGIETMSHSFFHLLRWSLNNELSLLWQSTAGVTGFIAAFVTPLICWPMVFPFLKRRISFEVRKGLHYLFIVWAVALLFHAPSRIPWLIGIPALVYVSDHMFGYFMKNNLVETAYFERYGENGVALHFGNPKSWENRSPTSYVYIMCPWISKYQWHAFTMFPEPLKENHSMLCIGASGDWTKKLHDKIQAPCLRQLYVHGPFITEFSDTAVSTSNAIAVASGIGITPTLSLVMNYAGRKRINIIWGVSIKCVDDFQLVFYQLMYSHVLVCFSCMFSAVIPV